MRPARMWQNKDHLDSGSTLRCLHQPSRHNTPLHRHTNQQPRTVPHPVLRYAQWMPSHRSRAGRRAPGERAGGHPPAVPVNSTAPQHHCQRCQPFLSVPATGQELQLQVRVAFFNSVLLFNTNLLSRSISITHNVKFILLLFCDSICVLSIVRQIQMIFVPKCQS